MNLARLGLASLIILTVAGCKADQREARRSEGPMMANQKFEDVKEPPIQAQTRFAAGKLAESRNDFRRAGVQYAAALQLDPNHLPAMNRLAVAYAMTRQTEQSIEIAKRYVKATGSTADAWNHLAQCYEFANKLSDAEAAYKSGIEKDPTNALCRTNFGLLLARTGRIEEAAAQMSSVLKPAEVHYNLASILEMQGDTAGAKQAYKKALEADPNLTDAKKRLAAIE